MSRTLSSAAITAINAQETDVAFLVRLTIDHNDLLSPLRVVNDSVDLITNSSPPLTFVAFPFLIQLPADSESLAPEATLTIDNVDQQIVVAIRSISSAPSLLIEIVRSADPDTVEVSYPGMELRNVKYDAQQVTGKIVMKRFDAEPYPSGRMTPTTFPGLF